MKILFLAIVLVYTVTGLTMQQHKPSSHLASDDTESFTVKFRK